MANVIFSFHMTEADEVEMRDRGYITSVKVRLSDGRLFPVMFYDAVRLEQDLQAEVEAGNCFVAEPGMIVLPQVTLQNMQRAVDKLEAQKFFDKFVPVSAT